MPKRDIQLGQRFRSYTGSIWEVSRIADVGTVPRHVVIVDVTDHTETKLVSESALKEPHLFRPAQPEKAR